MGWGTLRSCCEVLSGLGWGGGATAEVERGEDDTVEGGGMGDSPVREDRIQEEIIRSRSDLLWSIVEGYI